MGALDGKVAIITGAGHGLGRSHALLFAREGAKGLVLNDLGVGIQENHPASSASADETARLVEELGCEATAIFADCADMTVAKAMVDTALERWDRLDILVNNAGNIRDRMIFNMSEEDWDRVIRVHLKGHFATTRYATEYWRNESRMGNVVAGRIINTTSAAGLFGNAGQPNYAAAKAGIVGLTLALAFSMARYRVTANVIAPAAGTDPSVEIDGASRELLTAMKPEDVSPLVAFLASDKAAQISGQIFHAAGGRIDHVTHHQLINGVKKRGEPWTVDELSVVFDDAMHVTNPEPVQTVLMELAEDLLGAVAAP